MRLTQTHGSPPDGQKDRPAESLARLLPYAGFVGALGLLAAAYTAMAFGMEWRVERGQIGPGFFPRLVGALTVLGCVLAIVHAVRRGVPGDAESADAQPTSAESEAAQPTSAESGGAQPAGSDSESARAVTVADETTSEEASRTDARVTLVTFAAMTVFLWFFEVLGALLSSVLFLVALLSVVNRGHHRVNLLVGVLLPAALHLLFEVLLDAGLPPGVVLPL